MKGNQYSVKVYETTVEDEDKFISFFDNNHILFKDRLILINGHLSDRIKDYLISKSLIFINNIELPKNKTRRELELQEEKIREEEEREKKFIQFELDRLSNKLHNNLKVLDTIVRSGQELKIDGDLLLLNRVNSGATINITGNLIITQVVEGAIRCNGNFMMLSNSPKANIIFHGVQVDNDLLEEKLNRIELKDNKILITPILKKEINWAS
ncbi:Probable septum site-determining protein minC [hydrothermal vent metagenome]|uniref:Probable septum site-determining protein minC n=1 Tax=hydrothermal vent metagenome TaxID=652676 RepID=A0A1W1BS99_9ZZZZ